MSCLNLTRCFGGNHPDQPATGAGGGGGVAPAPSAPKAGDWIQRTKPYQDLSYEVPTSGAPGNWTECQLDETLPAEDPAATVEEGDERRSLLDRLRLWKLCSREKTPEELEIEMLRKEKKEILKALKNYGINDKRLNLAKIKNLRANIEQVLEQELKKLPEPVEMQDMKSSGSKAIAIPTLETNVDEVLPPLKEASVDYPLTQPDPSPQTVGDGRREMVPKGERFMSWKLASPINMPDIE
uniref:(northern house mosquito) hypothetical protein n=1 Tax=Culex pipiens TaxID=7175 RepID=A0A8D8MWI3_CULPI